MTSSLDELIDAIEELRTKDKAHFNNSDLMLYMTEELGEFATCLAVTKGFKNKNLKETAREEGVDIIMNSILLYLNVGGNKEHLAEYSKKKLKKWKKRVIN